jgi:hypothetical protein
VTTQPPEAIPAVLPTAGTRLSTAALYSAPASTPGPITACSVAKGQTQQAAGASANPSSLTDAFGGSDAGKPRGTAGIENCGAG